MMDEKIKKILFPVLTICAIIAAFFISMYILGKDDATVIIAEDMPVLEDFDALRSEAQATQIELFKPDSSWIKEVHPVVSGDSLYKIAKKHNITPEILKRVNNIDKDVIYVGMNLAIPDTRFKIIIDVNKKNLKLKSGEKLFTIYPVGVGKNKSTPLGECTIANKLVDPVWYFDGKAIPPGDPENLLGSRWMGFSTSMDSYGIHGTTDPASIGQANSMGCIRLNGDNLEELFEWVPIGTPVLIVDSSI